jgi:hypothetical protein
MLCRKLKQVGKGAMRFSASASAEDFDVVAIQM